MISLKVIALGIPLLIIIGLATLSFNTRHSPIKAEAKRALSDCPDSDNCVYSMASRAKQKVDALPLNPQHAQHDWERLIQIIQKMGGEVLFNDGTYCHAVFTSSIFRFKDDVELLLTSDSIQIRSASRAGKSDLGVNRKRVEKIRALFTQA
jgi:uncharacterized protein (DUF1499 family)